MTPVQPVQTFRPVMKDGRARPIGTGRLAAPYGVSVEPLEVLRRTFNAWHDDALRLGLLVALPYMVIFAAGVAGAIAFGLAEANVLGRDFLRTFGLAQATALGVAGGVFLTCVLLFVAASAGGVLIVDERLRGEERSSGAFGALLAGLQYLGRMLVCTLSVGGLILTLLLPAIACGAAAAVLESWPIGLGALMLALLGGGGAVFVALRLLVAGAALVIEDLGPVAALQRSVELTRGRMGDVFAASALMFVVVFAINMGTALLGLIPIVGALVQIVSGIIVGSLQSVFLVVLYAGLRDAHDAQNAG
jgi:hypothetical protein